MVEETYDLAVIGAGPAGFTAAIYSGRSGMRTVILEKQMAGGQIMISPLIENWPGDEEVEGQDLAMRMRAHAEKYAEIKEYSEVTSVSQNGTFKLETPEGSVKSKSLVIATGAEHRKLGVKGEEEFNGKGVSYCATCDGFFFKGKDIIVVGGGNTALLYAIYLHNIQCNVTLVHRRDEFRAEKALQEQVRSLGMNLMMDSVVEEFKGDDSLEMATIKNVKTGKTEDIPISGAFIAIGEVPKNDVAKMLALKTDVEGYIETDREMRTSKPGVYAAGDVTGGLKQIVSAAAEGAQAATSAFADLMEPYWIMDYKKPLGVDEGSGAPEAGKE